jgi:hypothetical protein
VPGRLQATGLSSVCVCVVQVACSSHLWVGPDQKRRNYYSGITRERQPNERIRDVLYVGVVYREVLAAIGHGSLADVA